MTEIFTRLIQEGLTPNSYYVLHCIKEKVVVADFINKALECKKLQMDHWLNENLQITDKSLIFITEIDGYFKKSKKKTNTDLLGTNSFEYIKKYNETFPNKKLPSGSYARSNVKNLENAFRWFFENHTYSWDTILDATEKYVKEYSAQSYQYIRTSQYFVRKQNTDKTWDSDLATYCEWILNGGTIKTDYFKQKVD